MPPEHEAMSKVAEDIWFWFWVIVLLVICAAALAWTGWELFVIAVHRAMDTQPMRFR